MAQIPAHLKTAVEQLLDNIIGEDCTDDVIRYEANGYIWKVSISKTKGEDVREITITIKRQKRI